MVWHTSAVHVTEKRCSQKGCLNRIQSCNKKVVETKKLITKKVIEAKKSPNQKERGHAITGIRSGD